MSDIKKYRSNLVSREDLGLWEGDIAPILDETAGEYADVTFGKVNVDEQPALANAFRVNAIPTLIVFKDGQAVQQAVGLQQKAALKRMIDGVKG